MRLDRIGSGATTGDEDATGDTRDRHDEHHASERSPTSESNGSSPHAGAASRQFKHEPSLDDDGADHHTIVDMSLRTTRYVVVLVIGLGFALAYAIFSFQGMELRSHVFEVEGTSTISDDYVEQYSSISGPIMFAVAKVLEFYLETLVFPTLVTYLHNCSFFPGDQPARVESKAKSSALYWAFKVIFILINVGLASLYVSQLAAGIDHSITIEDLTTNTLALTASQGSTTGSSSSVTGSNTTTTAPTSLDAPTAVSDTLLRSVVSGYAVPFELRTQCGTVNQTSPNPRIDQMEATSLSLAFPMNEWNSGLLPNGVAPVSSLSFTYGEYLAAPAKYAAEAASKGVNVSLAVETFVLGASLLERTLSNMDLTQNYNCTITFPKTNKSISAQCPGVQLDVAGVIQLLLPGNTTFPKLVAKMAGVSAAAMAQRNASSALRMGFAKYALSDELQLDAITLDIPLEGKFALDKLERDTGDLSTPVHFLDADECGTEHCVYKSFNTKALVRNEVLLTPFLANCAQGRKLDDQLYAFYPKCSPVVDAAMTYGVGSYITADALTLDASKKRRKLVNPRAFLSLAFGKLSWTYTPLDKRFDTGCTDDACSGLSLPLDGGDSVLLVGKDAIARGFARSSLLRPLRLLSLNSVFVPLPDQKEGVDEFAMLVIDPARQVTAAVAPGVFGTSGAPACDSLVDSYAHHVAQNHFYMDKPLQTMYTAALFYLLQNGVATDLVHTKLQDPSSPRRLDLDLAMEVKEITFSVSLASATATFIGCGAMCLLAVALMLLPTARVKQSPDTTPAAQYVQILTDGEMYPDLIHKKRLRFDNGDALLMNEYVVDNIVLRAKRDNSKKIYL